MDRQSENNRPDRKSETQSRAGAPGLTPERLAELLPHGAEPLDDERECLCRHLEADHRLDGACSRCLLDPTRAPWRRCPEFRAAEEEDTTAVLTEDELSGGCP